MRDQAKAPAVDLLRRQLARGARRAEFVVSAAGAAEIDAEELLEACDTLDVRARDGLWGVPD